MRLRLKIICYVVAWLAALFAMNPSGKYWPLAYMFPLGRARLVLFPLAKVVVDTASVQSLRDSAYLQCLGLPCHAEYALTSDHSL